MYILSKLWEKGFEKIAKLGEIYIPDRISSAACCVKVHQQNSPEIGSGALMVQESFHLAREVLILVIGKIQDCAKSDA